MITRTSPGTALAVGAALAAGVLLTACEPLALTAAGVGMSTGVSHTLGGMSYRTFTAPISRVRGATMTALNRMSIRVESAGKMEGGELIKARSGDRDIEIELEPISPNTTRMKAVARKGSVFYDGATAVEIIIQTEKVLGQA
ncbi:MAG: DUF3568 family protein [Betaproteobacteria bacterium]|nr:DUF3568 family protein [Betaproteobacteria bacterium]